MKIKATPRIKKSLTMASAMLGAAGLAQAGSMSHYTPGIMNIRDFIMPDQGFYGAVYNYYYTTDRITDSNGHGVNSVTISPGPGQGLTVGVNPRVDLYAVSPMLIWSSPYEFHGIRYGALIAPTFANSSLEVALATERGTGRNPSTSTFDVGDMYVQPIWLKYSLTNWDFSLAYGFYAPVGKYNTETVDILGQTFKTTAADNVGMGFWTQEIQGAVAWYPWSDKRMMVMGALTYEYNSDKQGIDDTPGQHLSLNWGVDQYLPLTKDQKLLLDFGPAGYDNWQISDDSGSAARNPTQHFQVHGVGGQVGLSYLPWNAALTMHGYYEYYAENGFQGGSLSLSLSIKF
jgi:hypothetical protein